MTAKTEIAEAAVQDRAVIDIPLSKLKKSPRNARRTPHTEAAVEALAASIAAKGLLQAPVVEPELDGDGQPTGSYLVTIGEGRRLALLLRAKRKEIRKTEPVRCVVDLSNDPHEISLDENVTRSDMHPADQFEAFRRLAEERGLGAEEIGARFGVSAHVVRQRLRLGAVCPELIQVYRDGGLTLDQLMAFAVTEDHARQRQVLEALSWNKSPHLIRRMMTEAHVPAADRRAVFVGAEAYAEAGGVVVRDLFTEDGGGWFEDAALLDRLATGKLGALAAEVREREGWKWAEASIDYPHAHGLRRVYPRPVERSAEDRARAEVLTQEYDALVSEWDAVEELPPEIEARFKEIDAALEAFSQAAQAYEPDEVARGGVFVLLGQDGVPRIERGFVRPEDEPAPEPGREPECEPDGEAGVTEGDGGEAAEQAADEDGEPDGLTPLSERLVLELTAYRTVGLRDALAQDPNTALAAVVHVLALRAFYQPYDQPSCLEIKATSAYLDGHAPGVGDSPAGRRIAERHAAWAGRLPREAGDLWAWVGGLSGSDLLDLLAHCASLSIDAVRSPMNRRPGAWAHADALAEAVKLDMTTTWTPTAASYLGRVTKARIAEAVAEAVSEDAAQRISDLKKPDMAQAAEGLLAGTGWLPPLLRTDRPEPQSPASTSEAAFSVAAE
ncbi:chromosome partitioning protein, ParB family [Tistlia consotensis]|uniref:Chromosome partitioning protein, ParB family n=1 Tax=Tistlia consotensis USBA 355 TaxID=560819 RepID=A0A1Y6C981_9PROT|nr:ParB/Srx family N-terminal domain-containing protein [Tistlia consotensis]SMF52319.1 chromosome partitioning protein, ParB family [Tistlia consotensis USBA 355]SNR83044.1 chromosome partitioning protein, ParB family [Tistlia consotensis]